MPRCLKLPVCCRHPVHALLDLFYNRRWRWLTCKFIHVSKISVITLGRCQVHFKVSLFLNPIAISYVDLNLVAHPGPSHYFINLSPGRLITVLSRHSYIFVLSTRPARTSWSTIGCILTSLERVQHCPRKCAAKISKAPSKIREDCSYWTKSCVHSRSCHDSCHLWHKQFSSQGKLHGLRHRLVCLRKMVR
jgi:hypothetical protein